MPILQIRRNFQITIPSKLRKSLGIQEGDLLDAELTDDEAIILRPRALTGKKRTFEKSEIQQWLKEDELSEVEMKIAQKILEKS